MSLGDLNFCQNYRNFRIIWTLWIEIVDASLVQMLAAVSYLNSEGTLLIINEHCRIGVASENTPDGG
jgi:hypothetical protein